VRQVVSATILLLGLAAGRVASQTVAGSMAEPGRWLVTLEDARGQAVTSRVSAEDGSFVLQAPRAGTWVVRAERVGFRPARSNALELAAGDTAHVALVEQALAEAKVAPNIVVDCSHANSFKKPELQPLVFKDCMHQIVEGNRSIVGLMLESNLVAGSQPIPKDKSKLIYGCSVTDPCIGWDTTEALLRESAAAVKKALRARK